MALDIYWPDSQLDSVSFDYDTVRIVVNEDVGRQRVVVATGQIGIEHVGLWDETIVEAASLSDASPFAERCWLDITSRGGDKFDSGSPARNERRFQTLEVTFQDGSSLRVAASDFSIE